MRDRFKVVYFHTYIIDVYITLNCRIIYCNKITQIQLKRERNPHYDDNAYCTVLS